MWLGQLIAMIGMSMVVPFLPFYLRDLGVTDKANLEMWSGLVFAAPFITAFIATPLWGMLSDKFGKRPMVIRAIFGLAVSQVLVGISVSAFQVFLFRMVQGAISGFIASALALVSAGTPKEKSGYAIGILQTATSVGVIIGPVLGGILADFIAYNKVFFIVAALCSVSGILIVIYVREPELKNNGNRNNSVIDNIKFSFSDSAIKISLLAILLVQISVSVTQPIFALFIETFEKDSPYLSTITGIAFGILGISSALASPFWGRYNDKKGNYTSILYLIIFASTAVILHTFISGIYQLFPLRIIQGFCIGGIVPALYALINSRVPENKTGGVMGIASGFTLMGNMLGPLICTLITFEINIKYVFLFSGLILLINLITIRKITT